MSKQKKALVSLFVKAVFFFGMYGFGTLRGWAKDEIALAIIGLIWGTIAMDLIEAIEMHLKGFDQ